MVVLGMPHHTPGLPGTDVATDALGPIELEEDWASFVLGTFHDTEAATTFEEDVGVLGPLGFGCLDAILEEFFPPAGQLFLGHG